ncbi:MAG TPA: DUF411 domain-containing protein [Gemmatimonadales bacterium]|jgi:hypothetical protein|nr:DUF411 domain-containing protein [Gemmatimonadales bacterium]
MMSRRSFVGHAAGAGLALAGGTSLWAAVAGPAAPTRMTIYMSPTCGCCAKWVDHVKAAGFQTEVHQDQNMDEVKDNLGVPRDMRSCHTALVDKYLIEGHVPADDIRSLLARKPKAAGLAAPGMPASSPGMAVPGEPHEPYDVLIFQRDGTSEVYTKR